MTLLDGKRALITGAAHGIGEATARLFAEHGARLHLNDIDEAALVALAGELDAVAHPGDVRQPDVVAGLGDDIGEVDVLVNNVGHWLRIPTDFLDSTPEDWQDLYDVNVWHVFAMTQRFLGPMLERGDGAIVNVVSIEGVRGYPVDPVYGAFKAAVVQFTRSLGVQVAPAGVRVNAVAPDITNSQQSDFRRWDPPEWADLWPKWSPIGRIGEPVDQARVILFLASELSGFVIGHTIPTDGGTGAAGGWYPSDKRPGRSWTNRPLDA